MCAAPHGGACCVGVRCVVLCGVVCCDRVWPPVRWGVLRWCVAPVIVGRFMVVCGPPDGGACCLGVWPPSRWGVSWWCVAPLMVGLCCVLVCCVASRCFAVCCVVLFELCCVWWWCVAPLTVGRAALVGGPPHGGACCIGVGCVVSCGVVCCDGVWPHVWWDVLRWCVTPLLVGPVVVVCGPPHGGAVLHCVVLCCVGLRCGVLCCVVLRCVVCGGGVWAASWWAVLRWGAVSCVVWPPVWWGVLRWCVAPLMVGHVVVVCGPLMVGCVALCCVVSCCVSVCCVMLCCVLLCVVVVCGAPHALACCVSVWPRSWWGVQRWGAVCCVVWRCVLCWCVASLMLRPVVVVCGPPQGGAVLRCAVFCRVAVCCVALCCAWWWCVAPLMVGCAVLVCGPPHGWACCVGARCVVLCGVLCCCGVWPPVWWGVLQCCAALLMVERVVVVCGTPHGGACVVGLCWRVIRCVLAGSMLGLFCWFAVVSAAVRSALSGTGRLWCLPGRDGRASLPSACGAPAYCPGGDVGAGLPSACGALPRLVVSRVSSFCRSFFIVPLSCLCAVFGRMLAGALSPLPPGVVPGGCRRRAVVLPFSPCLPVSAVGRLRRLLPLLVLPPPPRGWFRFRCCLSPVSPFFACSRSMLLSLSPSGFGYLPPPPAPVVCVARVLPPRCSFSLVCPLLACCCAPFSLSACVGAGSPARPSPPGFCFAGGASVPFVLALPAFFCPSVCRLFALGAVPPPLCACFRCSGVVSLVALRLCMLFRAVQGAVFPAVLGLVLLTFVCGVVPRCAALGCRVLCRAPRCCVVRRRLVWRRVCCCAGCRVLCCTFGPGVLFRSVLFALRLAVPSWPVFMCAVLCCVSWRCAALRCVLLFRALLCCCALCCLLGAVLLFLALLAAATCCAVPSGAVCFAACCAVLCCTAVCCVASGAVVSWCAVLCCSRCV